MSGARPSKQRHPITTTDSRRMVEMYYDGLTFEAIGKRTGRDREVVRHHLVKIGVHVPVSQTVDIERMIDWYERDVTVKGICEHFHVAHTTLYKHLQRRGIPLRNPELSATMRQVRAEVKTVKKALGLADNTTFPE